MSRVAQSPFAEFIFDDSEQWAAREFSTLNLQHLQTLRSQTAYQLVKLTVKPNDLLVFAQEEAYLQGKLECLERLLDESKEATQQIQSLHSNLKGN